MRKKRPSVMNILTEYLKVRRTFLEDALAQIHGFETKFLNNKAPTLTYQVTLRSLWEAEGEKNVVIIRRG